MAISACTRCGRQGPGRGNPAERVGDWWSWPHEGSDNTVLMVCPECIFQLVREDMERGWGDVK